MKVFKIHETQPPTATAGGRASSQVQETISPLVLSCIQLVTQVFNDLPAKIQTFVSNGVLSAVVNSLTSGGIPADLDMSHVLAEFMQMLTLNQDSVKLLKESGLVKSFVKLCLDPQKYFKHVRMGVRRDVYHGLDQGVQ